MKVISLFDGMACGRIALEKLGAIPDSYDAWETDFYAVKVATYNFCDIREHGDVFAADFREYEGADLLLGGSPCTYWSIAQSPDRRETTSSGIGWDLFRQYTRAIEEAKPGMFLYENNKSMSREIREAITEAFGFEPIHIDSALVSAQKRDRLYWCGVRQEDGTYRRASVSLPDDRGILLRDILDGGIPTHETTDGKSYCLLNHYHKEAISNLTDSGNEDATGVATSLRCCNYEGWRKKRTSLEDRIYETRGKMSPVTASFRPNIAKPICLNTYDEKGVHTSCLDRVYDLDGKMSAMTSSFNNLVATEIKNAHEVKDGMIEYKGRRYPIKLKDGWYVIRKLTVDECKRLQTVPDWYDMTVISKSQAYKCLGNGWTVDVIVHLLRQMGVE